MMTGNGQAVVELKNVHKAYGSRQALKGLDLQVEPGILFGLVGPNGAGKSTALRILLGLARAGQGEIRLFGQKVKHVGPEQRARIGYLPSETEFYPEMRVKELLRYAAGLQKKDCQARAAQLCRALDLDPEAKIRQLSLGGRKKAGIVCAMQHDPDLLILDEPTSGLDPLIQSVFFDLLHQAVARGVTVVFSSHNLAEVQQHCLQAAFIRDGRILVSGPLHELMSWSLRKVDMDGGPDPAGLPGGSHIRHGGARTQFWYQGAMPALLAWLSEGQVRDVTIAEPDLEDVFLHLYEDTGTPDSKGEITAC